MLSWFKRKAQKKITATFEDEINRFILGLQGGSASEVGSIVAVANHCRNHLEKIYGWNLDYPNLVAQADFVAAVTLRRMIGELQEQNSVLVPGLMVWLHSIRASQTAEIRVRGRAMWAQLSRGIPHAVQAASEMSSLTGVIIDVVGVGRVPLNLGPNPGSEISQ